MTEPPAKKPVQFSVRSQLAVTTVLAVICAGFVLFGWEVLGFVLWILELAAIAAIATIAVYSGGYRRTFFAAALFGAVATLYFASPRYAGLAPNPYLYLALQPLAGVVSAVVSGAVSVFTRRYVERRGWHLP